MVRVVLQGAAPDTSNLGVSALGESVVVGIIGRMPDVHLTIFDNGTGVRPKTVRLSSGERIVDLCGARSTKRLYLPEACARIRLATRLGGLWNPAAQYLLKADAILDISGGDSFTDLYGPRRFRAVTHRHLVALENGKPLILLPQTYGPFSTAKSRRIAERILRASAMAWARDNRSFVTLRVLLGDAFDPDRHKCGVDVAFGLESHDPDATLPRHLRSILDIEDHERSIGINVSGVIYHDPALARERYGFVADYRLLIRNLLVELVERSSGPVLLIPHVLTRPGHHESDTEACRLARESLPANMRDPVHLLPPDFNASETKWIISHCDWFCGTRMHSTIAGLSTGVPTAAIAYSLKTQGVFETCGLGEAVVDPRVDDTIMCVEKLLALFDHRSEMKITLDRHLPQVLQQAEQQMDEIVECVRQGAEQRVA